MNAIINLPLSGEIIAPGDGVTIIAALHPLKLTHERIVAPAGLTIAELVEIARQHSVTRLRCRFLVALGTDERIDEQHWHRVRPKPGTVLLVRAIAEFGGGNNLLKSILGIAAAAAGLVLAPILAPLLFPGATAAFLSGATGLIGAGITIAGQLAINALFPVAPSQLASDNSGSQTYSIAGGSNQPNPWGVVPINLGTNRVYPSLGADTYTEIAGSDQYLRMLFVAGYGPLDLSDIKIGETAIGDFTDVEIEIRPGYADDAPLTLFPGQVLEQDLSVDLTSAAGWQVRTTDTEVDEISIDVVAANGIVSIDDQGNSQNYTVSVQAQYSPTGANTWLPLGALTMTGRSTDAVRQNLRLAVTNGQYDVRVEKTTADAHSDRIQDDVTWTALRGFRNKAPIAFPQPLALIALRIRATSQLNGTIDQLNLICKSRVLAFNGTDWVPNTLSRNCADLFRHVLQSPANAKPVADAGIDIETLEIWWQYCDDQGFTFDNYRDASGSVYDALTDICAAGRAVQVFRDGLWSVVWDQPDSPIVQHFTPRNSWGFSGNPTYPQMPHAFRVQFINATKDYAQDERIVYDDGYDETNATLFEQIEFPGVTNPDTIWRMGRFHIAQARLRRETYTLTVDIEHIVCTRGDRVRVTHDVPLWGLTAGRVKAVDGLAITLDEPLTMQEDQTYSIRFRLAHGSSLLKTVVTIAGQQYTVTATGGIDSMPAPGDLFMAGVLGSESVVLRVRSITPADDTSATMTFVDDAPEISTADTGTIPAFNSQITIPPDLFSAKPVSLKINEGYEGTGDNIVTGVFFSWDTLAGQVPAAFEAQFADADGDGIWKPAGMPVPPLKQVFITPYQEGNWSFRARSLFANGKMSDWATLTTQPLTGGTIIPKQLAPGSVDVFALNQELQNIKGLVTGTLPQMITQLQDDLGAHAESVAGALSLHQQALDGLAVSNAGAVAYIETVESVAVTATNAVAQLQTDIGTTFGPIGASGGFRFDVESDALTGVATWSVYVKATNGNFTGEAALQLGATVTMGGEDSFLNIMADRMNFVDTFGGFVSSPFFIAVDSVTLAPYVGAAEFRFDHQLSLDGTSVEIEGRNTGGFTPFVKIRTS